MIYRNSGNYFRPLVAGAETKVPLANGKFVTAINFDNAATTPPLRAVLQEISHFAPWYASVHRGRGYKSILTSELYERAREVVKGYVKADKSDVVIFTKNTTESINMLAYALSPGGKEQVVLSTDMEHLANDLPWRDKFTVDYVSLTRSGRLSVKDLEAKLKAYGGKVILVTVTGASNVTGYINPIAKVARLAHKYGAKILVDGAQWVPHTSVDMKPCSSPEHIDYLTFSAHKMYAPFGAGVLIGPQATFANNIPVYQGGGAVGLVSHEYIEWDDPPAKCEAGTPNMIGVLALITAIETLSKLNINDIHTYERGLIDYAIDGLRSIPGINLYSTRDGSEARVSLISFTMEGLHHSQIAEILSQEAGIAVRNGLFCAHPYVEKLLKLTKKEIKYYQTYDDKTIPGLVRMSFGIYNTYQEIDIFYKLLCHVARNPNYYARKYAYVLEPDRCGGKEQSEYLYC